ncbi:MAG: DUF5069 domain-containing protein [Verrucomicrobiota bacterium]
MNTDKLQTLARDLRTEKPRPPTELLGGIKGAARTLDKCRATLIGWNGEYEFNCPFDRRWFTENGVEGEAFREVVAGGADDQEVAAWLESRTTRAS